MHQKDSMPLVWAIPSTYSPTLPRSCPQYQRHQQGNLGRPYPQHGQEEPAGKDRNIKRRASSPMS